jgi:hypothetical protein
MWQVAHLRVQGRQQTTVPYCADIVPRMNPTQQSLRYGPEREAHLQATVFGHLKFGFSFTCPAILPNHPLQPPPVRHG